MADWRLAFVFLGLLAFTSSSFFVQGQVEVGIALKQSNLEKFDSLFHSIADPRSPLYGKHLSVEELAAIVGSEQQIIDDVTNWLEISLNARDVRLSPTRDYLFATIPDLLVADRLVHHTHTIVPSHLRDSIDLVFRSRSGPSLPSSPRSSRLQCGSELRPRSSKNFESSKKRGTTLGSPINQKQAYGVPLDLQGTNPKNIQMVWGPCTYGFLQTDLAQFYQTFNLNASNVNLVHMEGYRGLAGGDNFFEATLDTQYISGMALGVITVVANTNDSSSTEEGPGFGDAFLWMAQDLAGKNRIPFVMSLSLGSLSWDSIDLMCQLAANSSVPYSQCLDYVQQQRQVAMYTSANQVARIDAELKKLGSRGVTILAAAGDGGSHFSFQPFNNDPIGSVLNTISCKYNFPTYPSASPWVVGVGGTQWTNGPQQPVGWSSGGGGFSWQFRQPAWQAAAVNAYIAAQNNTSGFPPSYAFNAGGRGYPDVSALAENIPIVAQGQQQIIGGTSASTPEFAGLVSLVNDHRLNNGLPPLGFLAPRLYQIAAENPGVAFYDITSGNSACSGDGSCCSTGFPATTGWDPVTGLGSPLFPGLLQLLGTDTQI